MTVVLSSLQTSGSYVFRTCVFHPCGPTRTCVFRTRIFRSDEMRRLVLTFSVLAFSSILAISAPPRITPANTVQWRRLVGGGICPSWMYPCRREWYMVWIGASWDVRRGLGAVLESLTVSCRVRRRCSPVCRGAQLNQAERAMLRAPGPAAPLMSSEHRRHHGHQQQQQQWWQCRAQCDGRCSGRCGIQSRCCHGNVSPSSGTCWTQQCASVAYLCSATISVCEIKSDAVELRFLCLCPFYRWRRRHYVFGCPSVCACVWPGGVVVSVLD